MAAKSNKKSPKILFGRLSKSKQDEIRKALKTGVVEVNCPWWHKDHWERKLIEPLWDEAYYRIATIENTHTTKEKKIG